MIKEVLHADGTITPLVARGNGAVVPGNASDNLGPRCRTIAPNEITAVLHDDRPGDLVYLDVERPTAADLGFLRETFNVHALAIEDIAHHGQRAKVDDYGAFVLVIVYAVSRDANGVVRTHEVDVFYSDHYLVTVHEHPMPVLGEAVHRWQRNTDILGNGIGALLYAVLDAIVDDYFPVLEAIEADVEHAEERVFLMRQSSGSTNDDAVQYLFSRRKELTALRRVIAPVRDVTATLARRDLAHLHAAVSPYMADVNDHVIRIVDSIDTARDTLNSAMEAATALQSTHLNQTIRTMTASTIILMGASLIAGIYGMNFTTMPELGWTYGYPFALALMVLVAAILIYLFRRARWF